jgi:hypothetical protein
VAAQDLRPAAAPWAVEPAADRCTDERWLRSDLVIELDGKLFALALPENPYH